MRSPARKLLDCHGSERVDKRHQRFRDGRRAGAQVETSAPRRMEQCAGASPTAASLPVWTTSSRGAGPGIIATRDCASWRRIARAIAIALLAQLSHIAASGSFARTEQAVDAARGCCLAMIGALCGAAREPGFLAGDLDEDRRRGSRQLLRRRSRRHGASELSTGTIGARRAWTVSMISVLSMPCR